MTKNFREPNNVSAIALEGSVFKASSVEMIKKLRANADIISKGHAEPRIRDHFQILQSSLDLHEIATALERLRNSNF